MRRITRITNGRLRHFRVLDDGTEVECAQEGTGKLLEALAARQFPGLETEDTANSGAFTISHMAEENPIACDALCKAAERAGYRPKPTDTYEAGLASFMGDPTAFCGHDKRAHIRKVSEMKRLGGHGMVDIDTPEPDHDPYESAPKLSPRIAKRILNRQIKANPDLARDDKRGLLQDIVSQHGKQSVGE